MRAVVQRVKEASVSIDGICTARIGPGFLVLLGISADDEFPEADWLCAKIVAMRIFSDEAGLMNLDLSAIKGELLVVSQFTLMADYRKGNRPSFIRAARPEKAIPIYAHFLAKCESLLGKPVQAGVFGADMQVSLLNDGPVTIMLDSKTKE